MKRPVVMKFGGTSVADPEKIQRASERAVAARRKGNPVVVVVSAPGEMTDELISLARQVSPEPDARELDVLMSTGELVGISLFAIACRARGAPAVSLSGPQAGFQVDEHHTRASITAIRPKKVLKELAAGKIVAVAGFQGINPNEDIATLGRGGSDLSAVALAAVLKASHCEIFTDVKGIYTADPRIVPEARKINRISYEEMLELSSAGAQVMQARSIEVAARYRLPILVRSSFHPSPGTWIVPKPEEQMEKSSVSSLALSKGEVRLSVVNVPDKPGVAARIMAELAQERIPVDMIVQSAATQHGVNDISIMTPRGNAQAASTALGRIAKRIGAKRVDVHEQVAKISTVGTGFRRDPAVAATMFKALADGGINIHMISTSDLRISCVIDSRHGEQALRLLHKAFKLGRR
ncbi:MAG: aspartate kinase [Elusimicrobiota bacterium]